MISVQNHRLRLNGNKLLRSLLFLFLLSACSPKRVPVPQGPPVVIEPPKEIPLPPAPAKKRVSTMALVLPFALDKINSKNIQQKDITRSAMALDFYQGFKMALDSLALQGHDFKLYVLDTRDNIPRTTSLAKSPQVQSSDIIIGPIFPEEIRSFGLSADLKNKLQVSPLAAGMPNQFNNSKLVTLNNPIDQHARKLADFINKHYPPGTANIFLVNPRKTEDEQFAAPIRKYLNTVSGGKLAYTEMLSLTGIENRLSRTKTNLVIVSSPQKDVVSNYINKLNQLSQDSYKIDVFGHPNWIKLQNLDASKLQNLNTRLTSSYYINNKAPEVVRFISSYKRKYLVEPSEYAFNGFDTGYLFGGLLGRYGMDYSRHLQNTRFNGLHNDAKFTYAPGSGYVNSNLMVLTYRDFALEPEE